MKALYILLAIVGLVVIGIPTVIFLESLGVL